MAKDRKQAKSAKRQARLKDKQRHQQEVARIQNRIAELLDTGDESSLEQLHAEMQAHPQDRNRFIGFLEACLKFESYRQTRHACREWLKVHPLDREVWRSYAGVCLQDGFITTGVAAAQTILNQWPDWSEASVCREIIQTANKYRTNNLAAFGPELSDELLLKHEEVLDAFQGGLFENTIRLAREALVRWPQAQPIRNNLAMALGYIGKYSESAEECRHLLDTDPNNVFAWKGFVHSLFYTGRLDEARIALDSMIACHSIREGRFALTAEMLVLLGQESRLIDWAEPIIRDNRDRGAEPLERGMLRHYVAASHARLGNDAEARKMWNASLQQYPMESTRDNLAELDKPVVRRSRPSFFVLEQVCPVKLIEEVAQVVKNRSDSDSHSDVIEFVQQHPELRHVARVALELGDADCQDFGGKLCGLIADEESLDLLESYVRHSQGDLGIRAKVSATLLKYGRIVRGVQNQWRDGTPTDLQTIDFEICFDPMREESDPLVQRLMQRAHDEMKKGNYKKSETLWVQTLEKSPNDPSLHFNLAVCRSKMDVECDMNDAISEIHRRWPDYSFARMVCAINLATGGKTSEARELIEPIMACKKLHFTEFRQLCSCQVEIACQEEKLELARSWLQMARHVLPDDMEFLRSLENRIEPQFSRHTIDSLMERFSEVMSRMQDD